MSVLENLQVAVVGIDDVVSNVRTVARATSHGKDLEAATALDHAMAVHAPTFGPDPKKSRWKISDAPRTHLRFRCRSSQDRARHVLKYLGEELRTHHWQQVTKKTLRRLHSSATSSAGIARGSWKLCS